MCGRFQLSVKGKHISERFNVEVHDQLHRSELKTTSNFKGYNCAPMQFLPVITNKATDKLQYFRWGLLPQWVKDERIASKMINARAETILEKPAFKTAFAQKRCLIPANGFYEWKKLNKKQPYRFLLKEGKLFAMAGIWESRKNADGTVLNTFSIITTEANSLLNNIHDRMPVILHPENEHLWLHSENTEELFALLKPYPAELMESYPISDRINSVTQDDAQLANRLDFPISLFD